MRPNAAMTDTDSAGAGGCVHFAVVAVVVFVALTNSRKRKQTKWPAKKFSFFN